MGQVELRNKEICKKGDLPKYGKILGRKPYVRTHLRPIRGIAYIKAPSKTPGIPQM